MASCEAGEITRALGLVVKFELDRETLAWLLQETGDIVSVQRLVEGLTDIEGKSWVLLEMARLSLDNGQTSRAKLLAQTVASEDLIADTTAAEAYGLLAAIAAVEGDAGRADDLMSRAVDLRRKAQWEVWQPIWFAGPENPEAAVAAVVEGDEIIRGGASATWSTEEEVWARELRFLTLGPPLARAGQLSLAAMLVDRGASGVKLGPEALLRWVEVLVEAGDVEAAETTALSLEDAASRARALAVVIEGRRLSGQEWRVEELTCELSVAANSLTDGERESLCTLLADRKIPWVATKVAKAISDHEIRDRSLSVVSGVSARAQIPPAAGEEAARSIGAALPRARALAMVAEAYLLAGDVRRAEDLTDEAARVARSSEGFKGGDRSSQPGAGGAPARQPPRRRSCGA